MPQSTPTVKSTLYSINKYETPLGFLSRAGGDCTGHWADKVISRVIGHNDSSQRQPLPGYDEGEASKEISR